MAQSSSSKASRNGLPVVTIRRLAVEGYKSISELTSIDLRPLTILAGANSSGKSSIIQPLLLLKQTLEATYDPGPLLINGPNVKFTSVDQFLSKTSRTHGSPAGSLTVEIELNKGPTWRIKYVRRETGGIQIKEWNVSDEENEIKGRFTPQMSDDDIRKGLPHEFTDGLPDIFRNGRFEIVADRSFFDVAVTRLDSKRESSFRLPLISFSAPVTHLIRRVIHLPGLRGNPERTYPVSAIGPTFDGTFESYAASVISHWARHNATNKIGELRRSLENLGLTWKVDAKPLDETQVELRVGRLPHSTQGGAYDLVNVADVGFGVSQTLPVLVAIIHADPGQIVYIEQPEIHLHPRAQIALAGILAKAARRGVRVVIETHSSLLLLAIQSLVAEGKFPENEVALHWFCRDEDGVTRVASSQMDSSGAFGAWPEDFGEVTLELQNRYLNASESRLPGFSDG